MDWEREGRRAEGRGRVRMDRWGKAEDGKEGRKGRQ